MKEKLRDLFKYHLAYTVVKRVDRAEDFDRYQALALSIRDLLVEKWMATRECYETKNPRTVNYISLEYLMGRALANIMFNLGVHDEAAKAM